MLSLASQLAELSSSGQSGGIKVTDEMDFRSKANPDMNEIETAEQSEPFFGDKLYQQRARAALPLLVRQAKAQKTIYYSNLAEELGMPNPRNLNWVLGSVGQSIRHLEKEWGETIPPIQCLVVNQADGLPGEGVGFFIDREQYKGMSKGGAELLSKPNSRRFSHTASGIQFSQPFQWNRLLRIFQSLYAKLLPLDAAEERVNPTNASKSMLPRTPASSVSARAGLTG